MRKVKLAAASTLCIALAAFGLTANAGGEIAQVGNLQVAFNGGIAPVRLPRGEAVPVTVRTEGKVKTTDRSVPPKLERIVLAINSNGKIQTEGLPTCSLAKLESLTATAAKKACGEAEIGHGNVTSRVSLPGQGAFASNGKLLAFNGVVGGKPAILAQVASGAPLPLTYVIVFEVKKTSGTFGTELIGTLPAIASEYGYISAFNLVLGRTYTYKGRQLSYASASCPAPSGFPGATFPFAKAAFEFTGGVKVSSTLVRECKVRGK